MKNFDYDGSSGGGVADAYAQPWYQQNVVPTSLAETEVTTTPITYNTGTSLGPSPWAGTRA